MLIPFIRKQQSQASLFILIGFLVFSGLGFAFGSLDSSLGTELGSQVISSFKGQRWLGFALYFSLVYPLGILLHRVSKEHFLSKFSEAWLPLFFIWPMTAFLVVLPLSIAHFALVFIGFSLWKLVRMYNARRPHALVFDSGLLIGIAGILYTPSLVFLGLIWTAILIYQFSLWRYVLISLIGAFTPFFLSFTIGYVFNLPNQELFPEFELEFSFHKIPLLHWTLWPYLVVSSFLLITSSLILLKKLAIKKIRERKAFSLVLMLLLISILSMGLPGIHLAQAAQWLILPASFIYSNYFAYEPANLKNQAFLWLWMIALIVLLFA